MRKDHEIQEKEKGKFVACRTEMQNGRVEKNTTE